MSLWLLAVLVAVLLQAVAVVRVVFVGKHKETLQMELLTL
jgi:hypothetical protein